MAPTDHYRGVLYLIGAALNECTLLMCTVLKI